MDEMMESLVESIDNLAGEMDSLNRSFQGDSDSWPVNHSLTQIAQSLFRLVELMEKR